MAANYKILGQVAPAQLVETIAYTAPLQAVVSSIIVCNRGVVTTTFRIAVSVGGAATTDKDYIYYNVYIPPNDTFIATVGITMSSSDVVKVLAGTDKLTFQLFGTEVQ